jgi:hypothetical protein
VSQDVGAVTVSREGHVVRLLGDLDPVGRMARVLVEIDDPFNLEREEAKGELPLLVGAFVNVMIDAGSIDDVVEVPRKSVRDGDQVYVFGKERKLEIRKIQVVWRNSDSVLVKSGLEAGDQVIVSRMSTPVEGMLLRVPEAEAAAAKRAKPANPVQGDTKAKSGEKAH